MVGSDWWINISGSGPDTEWGHLTRRGGGVDGGLPMSDVDYKKW